jgi:protein-disulfide isomerase
VRRIDGPVSSITSCLAAVLLVWTAVRAQDTTGSSAGAQAVPAPQAERHSPRHGFPSLGPAAAKNTLVFFTDYQCPVCPRALRELDQLVADFNGELRVEIHQNPLAMHRYAFDMAVAAKAAQRQGKFWEYHEALLKSHGFDRQTLTGLAAEVGLDGEAFAHDIDDPKVKKQVTAEAQEALEVNALGTPGFLINGHVEVGWASLPWFEKMIRTHSR